MKSIRPTRARATSTHITAPPRTTREISTDIQFLNTTSEPQHIEVAYDFFTMPENELVQEVVPFVMHVNDFSVPPHTVETVGATCAIYGGHVVSLMPHNHERTTRFTVDLIDEAGTPTRILDKEGFDPASDIRVYDTPSPMGDSARIRHACTVDNELTQDIVYGTGVNEMCTLFGYLYPPEAQQLGVVLDSQSDCVTLDLGQYR